MTRYDTSTIHRYLDGVFADVTLTPEVQDLKEEIRGNLAARVAELEAGGLDAAASTRRAIRDLGDVKEIIGQLGMEKGAKASPRVAAAAAYEREKVRQRPGFVVRTVLLSLAAVGGFVYCVGAGISPDPSPALALAPFSLALAIGLLVADSLRQETTSNHPLPAWRAAGYGLATFLCVAGLALVVLYFDDTSIHWPLIFGAPLVVLAIVLYSYLGATQTNRRKVWVRETAEAMTKVAPTRLEDDPAAAARFGIYSGILWILAIGAFIALSIGDGFRWSWLALLGALLIQMAMVARMVFPDGMAQKPRPDIME